MSVSVLHPGLQDLLQEDSVGPGNHGSGVVKTGAVPIFFEAKKFLVFHWPSRFELFATREVLRFGSGDA